MVGGCSQTKGLNYVVYMVTILNLMNCVVNQNWCHKSPNTVCTSSVSFQLVVHLLIFVTYPKLENWYQTKLNHQEFASKLVSTCICSRKPQEIITATFAKTLETTVQYLKVKMMSEVHRLHFGDIWIRNWNVSSVISTLGSTSWHQGSKGQLWPQVTTAVRVVSNKGLMFMQK